MNSIKNVSLNRRTLLRAAGIAMPLPFLDAMVPAVATARSRERTNRVPRMVCCYFPHGVCNKQWFPSGEKSEWELMPSMEPLSDLKDNLTVFSGLGHRHSEGGHEGADVWLTGADLDGAPGRDYANSISVDQMAARLHRQHTRIPSLELSSMSGPGSGYHSHTLAFNDTGAPIPGETLPQNVFDRLFTEDSGTAKKAKQQRIAENGSILDAVRQQANSLGKKLGAADKAKLDGYLASVREVERRVSGQEQWLDRPKPQVNVDGIQLDATPFQHHHEHYLDAMFDLTALAIETDTTRVATFLMAREAGLGKYDVVSVTDHHAASHHGGDPDMLKKLARVDRFLLESFARFLKRLDGADESDGTLLDSTMVLYGSGMNNGETGTHSPKNLPLILAGGSGLGIEQGQHLAFDVDSTPLCNVHLTMLQKMGIETDTFSDSSSTLTGL